MNKISKHIISVCGHIGTHKYNWQPESERFAIGYRSSVLIYNISLTCFYINRACAFVEALTQKYGRVYVYGLIEKNDKKLIKKFEDINQVVTTRNWCGGYVTNARSFRGKIKNLKKKFSAILSLNYNYNNYSLPREAKTINLPSIGVVDSNSNAGIFNYPIPINSVNFGVSRLIAYTFAIKIFKGLSKRIISRFKKLRVTNNKIKKKKFFKKRKIFIKIYFKKFKIKIKIKKRRIRGWFKKFNFEIEDFKKKVIRFRAEQKSRDFIEKNGQKWLTLEAASRSLKTIEKIKRLPKKKNKKKKPRAIIYKSNFYKKFYLLNRTKKKFTSGKSKLLSYIRFKKIKKVTKKKNKKRKLIRKKPRYRPNKKWKPKFKPKIKIVSIFNRIKKKIKLLNSKRGFQYSIATKRFRKNPKFVYRVTRANILRFKVKKIYKFLYKKRKILLIKRARAKKINKTKYFYTQPSINNSNNYSTKYSYQNKTAVSYSNTINSPDAKKNKNYRYYYKDFAYIKKPKKDKNGRRWNRTTTASFSGLYSTIELSPRLTCTLKLNFTNHNDG